MSLTSSVSDALMLGGYSQSLLSLVWFAFPEPLRAQFTDPPNYIPSPVGLNQFELEYAHVPLLQFLSLVDVDRRIVASSHFRRPGSRKPQLPSATSSRTSSNARQRKLFERDVSSQPRRASASGSASRHALQ